MRACKYYGWSEGIYCVESKFSVHDCMSLINNKAKVKGKKAKNFLQKFISLPIDKLEINEVYIPMCRTTADVTYLSDFSFFGKKVKKDKSYKEEQRMQFLLCKDEYNVCKYKDFGEDTIKCKCLNMDKPLPFNVVGEELFYEREEIREEVYRRIQASEPDKSLGYSISGWRTKIFYIPLLQVSYKEGDECFSAVVNMNNGRLSYKYYSTQFKELQVKKAHKTARLLNAISIALIVVNLIYAMMLPTETYHPYFLFVATIAYGVIEVGVMVRQKHNLLYFSQKAKDRGNDATRLINSEIVRLIRVVCFIIVAICYTIELCNIF